MVKQEVVKVTPEVTESVVTDIVETAMVDSVDQSVEQSVDQSVEVESEPVKEVEQKPDDHDTVEVQAESEDQTTTVGEPEGVKSVDMTQSDDQVEIDDVTTEVVEP